jgi:peptidoglycan biosynthesis protein MviN/MurJ (putative lipid II flippase)
VRRFGYLGLAVGTSVTSVLHAGLLLELLRRRLKGIETARLASVLLRVTLASIVMAAVAWGCQYGLDHALPGRELFRQMLRVGASIGSALVTLLVLTRILDLEEVHGVIGDLRQWLAGQ